LPVPLPNGTGQGGTVIVSCPWFEGSHTCCRAVGESFAGIRKVSDPVRWIPEPGSVMLLRVSPGRLVRGA